jgi:hypothetical protein
MTASPEHIDKPETDKTVSVAEMIRVYDHAGNVIRRTSTRAISGSDDRAIMARFTTFIYQYSALTIAATSIHFSSDCER